MLEHVVEAHGVETDAGEVYVRQLAFPEARAMASCMLRNADVGAADLPPPRTGVTKKGSGSTAYVEQGGGAPPDVSLETLHLSGERPLPGAIHGLVSLRMVARRIDDGCELLEHRPGMLEFESACVAASQVQALEIHAELPGLPAAQRAADGLAVRQGGLDLAPRAPEERTWHAQ